MPAARPPNPLNPRNPRNPGAAQEGENSANAKDLAPATEPPEPSLSPGDHLRMLIDLLQPMTPDLARRWLAALLLVDPKDREALVEAMERRVAEQYGDAARAAREAISAGGPREVNVVHPPRQHEGYVEQVIRTYEVREDARESASEESHPKRERKRAK